MNSPAVAVAKGTWLFASIIAGNHDPLRVRSAARVQDHARADADRFSISAPGRHLCLGRPVALVELEETLRLLIERFAQIEVVGEVVRDGQPHGDFVRKLPIRVTA